MIDTKVRIKSFYRSINDHKVENILIQIDEVVEIMSEMLYADFVSIFYKYPERESMVPLTYKSDESFDPVLFQLLDEYWCAYPAENHKIENGYANLADEHTNIVDDFADENDYAHRFVYSYYEGDSLRAVVVIYWKNHPHFNRKKTESVLSHLLNIVHNGMKNLKYTHRQHDYSMKLAELISMFEWSVSEYRFAELLDKIVEKIYQVIPDINYALYFSRGSTGQIKMIKAAGDLRLPSNISSNLTNEIKKYLSQIDYSQKPDIKWTVITNNFKHHYSEFLSCPLLLEEDKKIIMVAYTNDLNKISNSNMELLDVFSSFASILSEEAYFVKRLNKINKILKRSTNKMSDIESIAAMTDMASGMAHDFNNMIGGIIGRVQLLKLQNKESKIADGLETIEKLALNSADTLKRIQEFTSGIKQVKIDDIFLSDAVDYYLNDNQDQWNAIVIEKDLSLKLDLIDCKSYVNGSEDNIALILKNLFNNACEHAPPNSTVELKIEETEKTYNIKVINQGVEIPTESLKKIFYPFYSTKTTQSAGLGLSVVHGVVTKMGGKVLVKHIEGCTTFTVVLQKLSDIEEDSEVTTRRKRNGKYKILVVDDDEQIRDVLTDMLMIDGHTITTCSDGKSAVDQFTKEKYDLLITDLGMPGMSGLELADIVHKEKPKLPIAMITGWGTQLNEDEISHKGIKSLLSKPFHLKDIKNMISDLVVDA